MAMDHFLEEVAVKRNNTVNKIVYYFSWVVLIFSALIAAMILGTIVTNFNVVSLATMLIMGGIAAYTFLFHDRLLTEYEYTFTNGSLDFAEVYNNKKRKSLGSLNVRTVEAFGKVSSGSFHRYLNMKDIKRMNWFLNRDAELYYFYFSKDNAKKMIIFEPSEEMVANIRQYLPRGVEQEN